MQTNKPQQDLVTIVTVTYNAEELLEETIISVINQNYNNIEYIIIDGASTDGTIDIIKKYEDKIDYWNSEPDEGIYHAMNKAIKKASGKWINFMNAGDTFFDLQTVKYVMKYKDDKVDLIYGDYIVKETGLLNKARNTTQWYIGMPFCHQTLFTSTVIMKEELFDTSFRLAADHNFIIKMYHNKKKFFYIDKVIAIFSEGGFADNNGFLMYIESIKVFLDNKVSEDHIRQSNWYRKLKKDICNNETQETNKIMQENKQLVTLFQKINEVTKYSILKNPLRKYRSYKNILKQYYSIKENLK